MTGCNREPPQDVAHVQFRSRIAFKLVWVPNDSFDAFVLVDDGTCELEVGPRCLRGRQLIHFIPQMESSWLQGSQQVVYHPFENAS